VAGHVLGEERFQRRGKGRRDAASAFSSRCAASVSSSGTECKYQYVETGLTCPRYADRSGILAATSPPSRYQPASVRTAIEWRLCGIPHKRHYADGWVMRPAVTFGLAEAAEPVLPSA